MSVVKRITGEVSYLCYWAGQTLIQLPTQPQINRLLRNDNWPEPNTYRCTSLKPALTSCRQQCPGHVGISWHVEPTDKTAENQRCWPCLGSHSCCRWPGKTERCMTASNLPRPAATKHSSNNNSRSLSSYFCFTHLYDKNEFCFIIVWRLTI